MRSQSAKKFLCGAIAYCLLLCLSQLVFAVRPLFDSKKTQDISRILNKIYQEVRGFEKYPGCDFIKREFFVGEDDDDTNKDIHVVILVQHVDTKEKVTIQVTYMERARGRPVIGIAKYVKTLSFFMRGDRVEIIKSDFDAKEKERLLPGILQAIRDKKKLLNKL